jgi:hypothetical protein
LTEKRTGAGEFLDAVVRGVRHKEIVEPVNGQIERSVKLTGG